MSIAESLGEPSRVQHEVVDVELMSSPPRVRVRIKLNKKLFHSFVRRMPRTMEVTMGSTDSDETLISSEDAIAVLSTDAGLLALMERCNERKLLLD